MVWSRLRRRSMAPRRPVLFAGQYALALVTTVVLVASIVYALWVVLADH